MFVWLRTGFGKSISNQLSHSTSVLVVSLSQMVDQVESLRARGVKASPAQPAHSAIASHDKLF